MSTAWDTLLFRVASDLKNSLSLAVRKANQLLSCWFSRLAGLLSVFTETALAAASPKRVFGVAFHGPFSRISQNLVDSSKDRRSFFSPPRRFFDCASTTARKFSPRMTFWFCVKKVVTCVISSTALAMMDVRAPTKNRVGSNSVVLSSLICHKVS